MFLQRCCASDAHLQAARVSSEGVGVGHLSRPPKINWRPQHPGFMSYGASGECSVRSGSFHCCLDILKSEFVSGAEEVWGCWGYLLEHLVLSLAPEGYWHIK